MKSIVCGVLFLNLFCLSNAQKRVVEKEKIVIYPPFKAFFEKHEQLSAVRFHKDWITDSLELEMVEKDIIAIKAFNRFLTLMMQEVRCSFNL